MKTEQDWYGSDEAYAFVDAMRVRADEWAGAAPLWHGWALRRAFAAGAQAALKAPDTPPVPPPSAADRR